MRLTFRAKLLLIFGATGFAFALVIAVSTLIGVGESRRLGDLESRLLPKLELGPQLEGEFSNLARHLQNAVAAQDNEILGESRGLFAALTRHVNDARAVLDAGAADALLAKLEKYYTVAYEVSRRWVAGETGEPIIEATAGMQTLQAEADLALKKATRLDRQELTDNFAAARAARVNAQRWRLAISLASLAFVLVLTIWFSRDVLRVVENISTGFSRFGRGDFTHPIVVRSGDELGTLAREANQMAASLQRLGQERDHTDWLKTGQTGLAHELRGELEPEEVAERAVRFLSAYIRAPLGALYFGDAQRTFRLLGRCSLASTTGDAPTVHSFRAGEGLLGQAALQQDIAVIDEVPAEYLRVSSGTGEGQPRGLLLVPLLHLGKVKGVLELATFRAFMPEARELLSTVRETLVIALEVAQARTSMRELLAETQRQAQRLSGQEQELRANNEELQAQQEELRQTNDELDLQRKRLEQQNHELEEARRSLQQKAAELTTVSAYKSRFLANMSHELRTPLNSMLILSDLMARNEGANLTDKQVEFCRTIHGAGKDLLALINQVLDLSKIEAGKQQVQIEAVELSEIVQHLRRIFEPMATDKGLAFVAELEPGLPATIRSDRQRLDQILTNLLGNAIKFTTQGRVTLQVRRPGADARLRRADLAPDRAIALIVSDTGVGIAAKDQDLVFAPFERLETKADRRYGSTGLGLSIARELAALLGGELHLDSTPGKGSTFTCYLPFEGPAKEAAENGQDDGHDGPEGEENQDSRSPTSDAASASRVPLPMPITVRDDRDSLQSGTAHLLVIEDDPRFAEILAGIIHARGFKAVVATSGAEGLELARRHHPAGIILDVKLPDRTGWTVMEQLRSHAETQAIPVHFLSAVDAPERGWAMGAIGYLTKPASHRELVSMVQTLAPTAGSHPHRILVLEENADRAQSLKQLLASDGLEAVQVKSMAEAFSAMTSERFVCLVLDVALPDMSGLEFLEALKRRDDLERPPVVVYTGRALTKDETRRIEEYAQAVVLKEGRSSERLLEEIRLFIHHLERRLPREHRQRPRLMRDEPDFRGKKMLVVDDDMRTVYALSALLRTKGVEVLMADTGRAALETLKKHSGVDAVIMDVMMPEMDGYEAMRLIRQEPRYSALPVIALTAKAMKGERERCLEAGASDYLSKPVDNEELVSLLANWLGPAPQRLPPNGH
jgi:CheY-like chemotaxis protein/signal transduction histidine kinase